VADEVKIGGSANPDMVPLMRRWTGGDAAGANAVRVGIVMGAVTVVDEDVHMARARARQEVAPYLDVVGRFDPTVEIPAEVLAKLGRALRESGPAAAARWVPDDILDRFAFAGSPTAVAEHAIRVLEAGADRIEFGTPHGLTDDRGIELLGTGVLPAIREELERR
jgi:5,10-methylenetetrahydromethanopterin reductase